MKFILFFDQIALKDIPRVGGKNASLGEMTTQLKKYNIDVPYGFATTAEAYWHVVNSNNLLPHITKLLAPISSASDITTITAVSTNIRSLIENCTIPDDFAAEILHAYTQLSAIMNETESTVAVRSSATAEDLPTASFAGQQESFLNISGYEQILTSIKHCMSSLFTPRAIAYRIEQGFAHSAVALSVGVQTMIPSRSSGVAFTIDTETGFQDVIVVNGNWGFGESVVQGAITPDAFYIHKPTLRDGYRSIIRKQLGSKKKKTVFNHHTTTLIETTEHEQSSFCATDDYLIELAQLCLSIEQHYSDLNGSLTPMDIEWAIDDRTGKLYIIQARPETIHNAPSQQTVFKRFHLINTNAKLMIVQGQSIGQRIATGTARIIHDISQAGSLKPNDIIVTTMTDPDWVPVMKQVQGIITDRGGRTCHAAIVSRELAIPAIVGTTNATTTIRDGETITMDCSQGSVGTVYRGELGFEEQSIDIAHLKKPPFTALLNIADPDTAFTHASLPAAGVGLARIEFIFSHTIIVHPMALLHPEKLSPEEQSHITEITRGYASPIDFFVNVLAQEVGTIAAAFYPRPVNVRFSDLKSNEYRNLIGGSHFEPFEENPMLGLRGASRYYHPLYRDAFKLECAAIAKARKDMGLTNIRLMIPFVRTLDEAQKVLTILEQEGLKPSSELHCIMMCEIPANVLLIEQFAQLFHGFSIGSNDLTQFTLAVDRDSALVAPLFDEQNEAVKIMLEQAIKGTHRAKKYIGICGQAPSDFPDLRTLLVEQHIDSISLNPDAFIELLK